MPKTPVTLDESKQNRMRKLEAMADRQERDDLQAVLNTPPGRRVMYRILEIAGCGVLTTDVTVYSPVGVDTHETFSELGERNLGQRLKVDWLRAAPGLFSKMMQEATDKIGETLLREQAEETKSVGRTEPEEETDDV